MMIYVGKRYIEIRHMSSDDIWQEHKYPPGVFWEKMLSTPKNRKFV